MTTTTKTSRGSSSARFWICRVNASICPPYLPRSGSNDPIHKSFGEALLFICVDGRDKWESIFSFVFQFLSHFYLPTVCRTSCRVWNGLPHGLALFLEIPYALFPHFPLSSAPADLNQSNIEGWVRCSNTECMVFKTLNVSSFMLLESHYGYCYFWIIYRGPYRWAL